LSLLVVDDIVKRYPIGGQRLLTAVNRVSFSVSPGETLAIVGESGSGKTTVARCVLGLTDLTAGAIRIGGVDIGRLGSRQWLPVRRRMQAVFQDPFDSLDPRVRIGAIIEEPLNFLTDLSSAARRERVRDLMSQVRLRPEVARLYPHHLTGGELQRVAIARALAPEPEFLVLDEPTSSLDPVAREEIIGLLRKLQATLGTAFLFISHDLVTVKHLCHRIAVMYLGEVVEEGPVGAVFDRPRHPYTRALLASAPSIEARLKNESGLSGEIPSPIDLPKGCFLASRCPFVLDGCRRERPALEPVGEGRTSRCLRATGHLPPLPADGWGPVLARDVGEASRV
jgi:oligopeptide/dipeptide ABC transporter ATP-binding protein